MAKKVLESLTPEEEAMIPAHVEKWVKIGLCCDPLDFDEALPAVDLAYKAADLAPPRYFFRFESPMSASIGGAILQRLSELLETRWAEVEKICKKKGTPDPFPVYDGVRKGSLWDHVVEKVKEQLAERCQEDPKRQEMCKDVPPLYWAKVPPAKWPAVWAHLEKELLKPSGNEEEDRKMWQGLVRYHWNDQAYGPHDAGWLSHYEFLGMRGLEDAVKPLEGLTKLALVCGWWSPYVSVAILQDRHCEVHMDDQNRTHNDNGMAIKYRDGWGVWSINGVRVNEQIVMRPETQTIQEIIAEDNEEIRRVRINRYGWPRFLEETGAEVIDHRRNDIEVTVETLLSCKAVRDREIRALMCPCPSTGRIYVLEVDPAVKTCEEAQNWLFNKDNSRYGKSRTIGRS